MHYYKIKNNLNKNRQKAPERFKQRDVTIKTGDN